MENEPILKIVVDIAEFDLMTSKGCKRTLSTIIERRIQGAPLGWLGASSKQSKKVS